MHPRGPLPLNVGASSWFLMHLALDVLESVSKKGGKQKNVYYFNIIYSDILFYPVLDNKCFYLIGFFLILAKVWVDFGGL